jgi:hypothetical protein
MTSPARRTVRSGVKNQKPYLAFVYGMWALAIVLLYFPCAWFAEIKARRKDQWLSYLEGDLGAQTTCHRVNGVFAGARISGGPSPLTLSKSIASLLAFALHST